MATSEFNESLVINCSIENAFALMRDIDRHVELDPKRKPNRNWDGGLIELGDTYTVVDEFMGRESVTEYTVTVLETPSRMCLRGVNTNGSTISSESTLTPVGDKTQLNVHVSGEPKGFLATIALTVLRGQVQKGARDFLEVLKVELEKVQV